MSFDFVLEGDRIVRMRDGVTSSVDIYRPARDGVALNGRFPVLLERALESSLEVAMNRVHVDAAHPSRMTLNII